MKSSQIFPTMIMVLSLGSMTVCMFQGDYKKSLYWFAAALLTYTVTY